MGGRFNACRQTGVNQLIGGPMPVGRQEWISRSVQKFSYLVLDEENLIRCL